MKKLLLILPLVFLLCLTFGCQDKEAMAELEAFKAQAALEEQNEQLIRNFFKEIDSGNWEIFNEIMADDAKIYFPSNNPPFSKEQWIDNVNLSLKSFPKWQHDIKDLITKGDKVIVHLVDRTTHEGEYQGIPATGNEVEFGVIIIFRMENGKVVEAIEEADVLGWMMQLGMELKPKKGEK